MLRRSFDRIGYSMSKQHYIIHEKKQKDEPSSRIIKGPGLGSGLYIENASTHHIRDALEAAYATGFRTGQQSSKR
jgi:hypothetical protein